ncbi:bifunctional UDP-N-acetylglucosamine diphosphorylase/glucosamine-1-phosphate N-acetyltransferase GlmU [Methyloferula stellata]|uniref:bifunctional UDP-N-acetylglucosamine diphosphorylase/glucosamine-1-phosphate N-acetyltransferase GlmU n=1 Tax=Methyloferula stellata TaxID=876270 RepID=UPI00036FDFBC|nr:bifunctional UDP-N-acetylglucosamine diphosphorylase/glucosamine-1-phosphate N-acetyltransferase GlmU [Methyloferula stellata]
MNSEPTSKRTCLAVVLAAGEGTRMKSSKPKVLHALAGRSMLAHVLAALAAAEVDHVAVVVGPGHEAVEAEVQKLKPGAEIFLQTERRGTAHAVLAARQAIARGYDDLLVVFADTPLVRGETFLAMRRALADYHAAVVVLGFEPEDPTGYGRLIRENGELVAIREEKDASEEEREIGLCNAGLMAFGGHGALKLLDAIGNTNAKNEYYLTDAVAVARAHGVLAAVFDVPADEVLGVNDRFQLSVAESYLQERLRLAAMQAGVTMREPTSVYFSFDTVLGRDVTIEPHVVFGPGVTVAEGASILAFSHLEGASVGPNAIVGPFARLRPGAVLHENVHVGNFVEVKAAVLEAGVKANHLSYIGDAKIGARSNIGAGTITCNYNGFSKFFTEVGEDAFVGVHSALVAPVKIGAGAYIGTGSVITQDVPADALALARVHQIEKPGWAAAFRAKNKKS